jgi:voltage-gated potassium channel
MGEKTFASLAGFFSKNRFIILLAAILGLIIGKPLLTGIFNYRYIPDMLLTIIFIAAIHAVSQKRKHIFISLALAVPMFGGIWFYHWFANTNILAVGEIFGILFVGFTINCLIRFIFNEKEVTKDVIYAAVVVYLLMAITWAFAYLILEFFYRGSFSYPAGQTPDYFHFLYFSCVTITTLGYGDVLPLTQEASSLAILEAITGQMYLVVVVAWLVGMYVSRRSS